MNEINEAINKTLAELKMAFPDRTVAIDVSWMIYINGGKDHRFHLYVDKTISKYFESLGATILQAKLLIQAKKEAEPLTFNKVMSKDFCL